MATGYWSITSGAETNWTATGAWKTTSTGTTNAAYPNGTGQIAYVGQNSLADKYASLYVNLTNVTISDLIINAQNAVGNLTGFKVRGGKITFNPNSTTNGFKVLSGHNGEVVVGEGWVGQATLLSITNAAVIENQSSNQINLHDADSPIYLSPAAGGVADLFFKTQGTGNIFIGKSIDATAAGAAGQGRVTVDSTGSGWTYFGNQSPLYEVTTYGSASLGIYRGNFAFNHSRVRRGDTNTFPKGITLGSTFRGANEQINLDAWIEYLTTAPINFGTNGTGADPVNLNYFGSANATFGSSGANNIMSGPSSGQITHTLNIQGNAFIINGPIVSNTNVAHSNVIKNGNGTLILNGNSPAFFSYRQNAGITRIGSTGSLGTGLVTLAGGTLSSTSATGYSLSNSINLGGTVTIGDSTALAGSALTGYLSFSGTPTISSALNLNTFSDLELAGNLVGSSNIIKTGNSGLGLVGQGASTYAGAVTVNSGVVVCGYWNAGIATQLVSASFIDLNGPGNGRIWYRGTTDAVIPTTHRGAGGIYSMNLGANSVTFTGDLSQFTGYIECYTDGGITSSGLTFANASAFPVSASYMAYSSWGLSSARTQKIRYTGPTNITSNAPLILSIVANGSTAVLDHSGTGGSVLRFNREITNNVGYSTTLQLNVASGAGQLQLGGLLAETSGSSTSILKTGPGEVLFDYSNINLRGTITISSGSMIFGSTSRIASGSYSQNIINSGTFHYSSSANQILSGTMTGGGNIIKSSTGKLTLAGITNPTGSFTINSGTVSIASNQYNTLGTAAGQPGPSNIIINSGGVLSTDNTTNNAHNVKIVTLNGGRLTSSGSTSNDIYDNGNWLINTVLSSSGESYVSSYNISFRSPNIHVADGNLYINSQIINSATGQAFAFTSSINKTGNGTLALSGLNTYTGGTVLSSGVISFTSGALGSVGSIAVNSGSIRWASSNVEDISSRLILSSSGTASFDTNGNNVIFASAIGNSLSANIIKAGTGILSLTQASTHTGGTRISAGAINFTNGALGSAGSIVVNGGSLQWSSANTQDISSRLVLESGGTASFDTNGNNVTLASSIGSSATSSLIKDGTGTLTLSAASTYTGRTVINSGTLSVSRFASGSYSADIVNNSALIINNSSNQWFGGVITGVGSVTKIGSGDLSLAGNNPNTFSGGLILSGGITRISNNDSAFGSGQISVGANATIATDLGGGARTIANTISVNSGSTLSLDSGYASLTLNGAIVGSGSLTTTSTTGTTILGASGSIASSIRGLTIASATGFTISGSTTITNSGAASRSTSLTSLAINALSSTTATTIVNIAGGTNIFTGIGLNGTINISAGNTTVSGSFYIGESTSNGPGIINQTGGTVNILTGSSAIRIGHWAVAGNQYNLSGGILNVPSAALNIGWDGTSTFTVAGSGTANLRQLTLGGSANGSNVFRLGDATAGSSGGRVNIGAGGIVRSSNSTIHLGNGIIGATSNWSSSAAMVLSSSSTIFDTLDPIVSSGRTVTLTGVLSGTGGFIKQGAGTLILSASNTFSGKVVVTGGGLSINADAALGAAPASAVPDELVLNGGTFGFSSAGQTLNVNRGITIGSPGGIIDVSAHGSTGTSTFSSVIAGSGSLTLRGSGNTSNSGGSDTGLGIRLAAANTFTGSVTITNGLVSYTSDAAFGHPDNSIILSGGGLLDNAANINLPRNINAVSGTTSYIRLYANTTPTWSGKFTGAGTINRTDMGTLRLTGDLTEFSGTFALTNSTSHLTLAGQLGSIGGSYTTVTSANLTVSSSANQTLSGNISGAGMFTKDGSGKLTLVGRKTYTGSTTISNGTLSITGSAGLYTNAYNGATITVSSGSRLELENWEYGSTKSLGQYRANPNTFYVNNGTISIVGTTPTSYGRGVTITGGVTLEAAIGSNWTIDTVVDNYAWVYNNSPDVRFTGGGSGTFQKILSNGAGSVTKSGSGTWFLTAANTYTGGTTVADGTLVAQHSASLGIGPVTLAGGILLVPTATSGKLTTGNITLTGGTIKIGG